MTDKQAHKGVFSAVRQPYWVCLLLVLITLAVYWQVKDFEFISYDDPLYVTGNRHVQKGLTGETIVWAFTDATRVTNYWVPLTWLSILLDFESYGLHAGGYHLTNVLFHILNVVLLFVFLQRATGAFWQSAFVAGLFALHPLHVESVAWVTERKDVLSTFFWLLTLLGYGAYVRRPGRWRYLLMFLLFILGVMAKPMLVTLPFVLLLLDYWPLGRMSTGTIRTQQSLRSTVGRLIWEKTPFFVVVIITGVSTYMTQQAGGAVKPLALVSFGSRIANTLVSYVSYIGKMFWPVRLSFLYPYPGTVPAWQWVGALVIIGLISYLAFRFATGRGYLAVGWLWYVGTLLPVSGLIVIGPHAMADRYTYVPLIGLYIMLAWVIPEGLRKWRYRGQGLAIAGVVVLSCLAMTTWAQVRYWQNSITLYQHAVEATDNNVIAHNLLGNALEAQDRIDEAAGHYFEALRINPRIAQTHNNLGLISARKGMTSKAIRYFSEALRMDPNLKEVHYNLGSVLVTQGDTESAIAHFNESLRIDPFYAEAHYNLGISLLKQGRNVDAIDQFRMTLQLAPGYASAHHQLGMSLVRQGKLEEGIGYIHKAFRLNPDDATVVKNLSWASTLQQKIDGAAAKMERSFGIDPTTNNFKENMRALDGSKKELDRLINQYKLGLSILPGFKLSEFDLGNYPKVFRAYREYEVIWPLVEKIDELSTDSTQSYYYISGLYAVQNKTDDSIHWLKKAIENGFNNWDILNNDSMFNTIRETIFYRELIQKNR